MTTTHAQPLTATTAPVLSAVPLDHPALHRIIGDWSDRHQIHQAVMSLFREDLPGPQHQRRATSQILYRVEREAHRILLQSRHAPQRTDHGTRTTHLDALLAALHTGMSIRIRLDINAVHCQSRTHRRTPVSDRDLPHWLAQRLHPALDTLTIHNAPITVHTTGKPSLRIAHITATAHIADHSALTNLIHTGVGRAKAYGCGLLTALPTTN